MPILAIRHVTTYHYRQPVAFGEHRMMLRPRDDGDQAVLMSELDITPEPSELVWTQDAFGNHVAIARFTGRACELRFESTIFVDHAPVAIAVRQVLDLQPVQGFGGNGGGVQGGHRCAQGSARVIARAPYLGSFSKGVEEPLGRQDADDQPRQPRHWDRRPNDTA